MKSTCEVCGEPVVSSLDQRAWYHLPANPHRNVLSQGSLKPKPHQATPGEIVHDCSRPDPHCPGEGCGPKEAARWARTQLAGVGKQPVVWPGD